MASVALSVLRTRARTHADMTGSTFVTDAELTAFLNQSLDVLHGLLVEAFGSNYYVSSSALTTVNGTGTYALPSDFYKLFGIDLTINGVSVALRRFQFAERAAYSNAGLSSANQQALPRYHLEGTSLRLRPTPTAVYTGTLWYAPTRTQLSADADAVNFTNGWEEFAVLDAAIKCLDKEESDTTALVMRKAELKDQIERAAEERDIGDPSKMVDLDLADVAPWGF